MTLQVCNFWGSTAGHSWREGAAWRLWRRWYTSCGVLRWYRFHAFERPVSIAIPFACLVVGVFLGLIVVRGIEGAVVGVGVGAVVGTLVRGTPSIFGRIKLAWYETCK